MEEPKETLNDFFIDEFKATPERQNEIRDIALGFVKELSTIPLALKAIRDNEDLNTEEKIIATFIATGVLTQIALMKLKKFTVSKVSPELVKRNKKIITPRDFQ